MPAAGGIPLDWLPSVLVLFLSHGDDLFMCVVVKALLAIEVVFFTHSLNGVTSSLTCCTKYVYNTMQTSQAAISTPAKAIATPIMKSTKVQNPRRRGTTYVVWDMCYMRGSTRPSTVVSHFGHTFLRHLSLCIGLPPLPTTRGM